MMEMPTMGSIITAKYHNC
jgi:hypothetical protein